MNTCWMWVPYLAEVHVVPKFDYKPHSPIKCWCHPEWDRGHIDDTVLVHNALDQRETYQEGRKYQ